jgi:hypothetical protein
MTLHRMRPPSDARCGPTRTAPDVVTPALRSDSVARCLLFAVALDALLHLFVDLTQRQATRAFQFVWIGVVCHGNGLVRSEPTRS